MARLIYIVAFVLAFAPLTAQEGIPVSAGETVFISTNSSALVSGETLYYKLFCLNPEDKTPSQVSQIAYVELVSSDRKSVASQKINLENGSGSGDFFIPATMPSGKYKLTGYTKRMLDYSATNFFTTDLAIINTFQPFEGEIRNELTGNVLPSGNSVFSITTDKKSYSPREKVVLKINPETSIKGNYSLSVKKISVIETGNSNIRAFSPPKQTIATDALPELRGEMLSGRISSEKNAKKLGSKNVALSIPGKSFSVKIVQTDRNGRFFFILDKTSYAREAVIEIMEPDRQEYSIVMDERKLPDYSNLVFGKLSLDVSAKDELEKRSVAMQVENAYFERKKDSTIFPAPAEPFFHPLEKVYVLDDYTRFPTLKETIIEVLKEMYSTKENGHYAIHLRNMTIDNEIFGPPLILVDGLPVQDLDELFAYGMKNVEKVSLINEPYVYGPKTFSGVANFTTKLQDFKASATGGYIRKLTLERPAPEKKYFSPDYSDAGSKIPDYRQQLLWSDLSGESQEITFYTSDVIGEFEIAVEGFTETGIPVSWHGTFEIK